MKRLKNIGLWTAALLLLASCSKIAEPCYEKENKEVQLKIAIDGLSAQSRAVATEADEAYIGTVQLFIFPATADKSGVAERIVTLNTEKGTTDDMQNTWNSATGIFTLRGVTGRKTVYVVANGTAANGYDPATFAVGTTTQADLDNIVTERRGNVVTPVAGASGLLMAGSRDVDFTANSTATIDLVRQVAKIKLHVTFDKTFSDSYPAMKFGVASIAPATVTACNVPTHSYLLALPTPELPAATLFGDYKAIDFVHIGAETDRVWQTDVYVYENPQTGDSQADKRLSTQFVVSIPYTDGTTATVYDNSYLVYINDPAAAASPHKTLRNIQYRINVTVKGFGSGAPDIEKATFITEVLPWNVVNSNGSV
ncbi:MAG: fimbrial protein, partial [Mucinivorans sp.]